MKTSSKTEWDFYKSFLEWHYAIQARLYWRIIRDNIDRDPYFKDFKLAPYKFIVANKRTLTPLVWNFKSTEAKGDLTFGKNGQIVLRDPFTIGEELNSEVFVTHFEKANHEISGIYQAINRMFAENTIFGYIYVNREDDMGIEGLRKAKLSYNPVILLDKYYAYRTN